MDEKKRAFFAYTLDYRPFSGHPVPEPLVRHGRCRRCLRLCWNSRRRLRERGKRTAILSHQPQECLGMILVTPRYPLRRFNLVRGNSIYQEWVTYR